MFFGYIYIYINQPPLRKGFWLIRPLKDSGHLQDSIPLVTTKPFLQGKSFKVTISGTFSKLFVPFSHNINAPTKSTAMMCGIVTAEWVCLKIGYIPNYSIL